MGGTTTLIEHAEYGRRRAVAAIPATDILNNRDRAPIVKKEPRFRPTELFRDRVGESLGCGCGSVVGRAPDEGMDTFVFRGAALQRGRVVGYRRAWDQTEGSDATREKSKKKNQQKNQKKNHSVSPLSEEETRQKSRRRPERTSNPNWPPHPYTRFHRYSHKPPHPQGGIHTDSDHSHTPHSKSGSSTS